MHGDEEGEKRGPSPYWWEGQAEQIRQELEKSYRKLKRRYYLWVGVGWSAMGFNLGVAGFCMLTGSPLASLINCACGAFTMQNMIKNGRIWRDIQRDRARLAELDKRR